MRERLEAHLSTLKREKVILGWHDRKIEPGADWKGQIDKHLETSDIVLLLISADFLASDYCYDIELDRALARHDSGEARVIPIILRPCDWPNSRFGKLQALPRDGKPVSDWTTQDGAFNEIARGIRRIVAELTLRHGDPTASTDRRESASGSRVAAGPPPESQLVGIPIGKDILEKLERMRTISAMTKAAGAAFDDERLMTEYGAIQTEMAATFLPLVKLLVRAGLLTMTINVDDSEMFRAPFSSITGEPTAAYENGNIWIDSEYSGATEA
jgi:hypothetical protein